MDLGGGVEAKIKLFGNMVMLNIKLKLTTHAATGVGSKGQTITLSESSHVAYQIKEN